MDDAESTSGECLMQNSLLKSTVQVEDMQEDGAADESESQVEDEASEDVVQEEDEQYDHVDDGDVPKCTAKADCKGEGQDCVGGICVIAASLKYKWTLATVDKKCKGKSIDALDKGKPEILTCKKKCEKIPGCTGFNRGKKGAIESRCWFFTTCTKDTPKGQLATSTMHNVYFVSATAEVEVSKTITEKKNMKVLGLTQGSGENEQEAEHHEESEEEEDQHETEDEVSGQETVQDQEPPKCAAKADCKGEGQDCVGGVCVIAASLKYKWTLATVDKKCPGKSIDALDKGKPEILTCKKKCEKIPGCTGFNRGKKGAIESRCWFFSACTKDTPKGKLATSTMHNVYFVSATAEVEIVTVTKKSMKVLG